MRSFLLRYLVPRLVQYFAVIFIGVTVTFIIPRLAPTNPVESQIGLMTSSGQSVDPTAIEHLRESLTEMYGLSGSPIDQYFAFWGRLFSGDLGPSLSSFPTPVSELVGQAMPWTLGIVVAAALITWILGNMLGVVASYYPNSRALGVVDVTSQAVRPIPYYVVAIVLLVAFAHTLPFFPFAGAYSRGVSPSWTPAFIADYLYHATLPALTLIMVGFGGWFLGMRALTSNVISEDYVVYAETAGIRPRRVLSHYVTRNAMLPQVTGLAMELGSVFSGALIMEVVFGYPGIGTLSLQAVQRNDYSLMMGVTLYSIIGVATAVLIIDLLYPLLDPRVRYQ
jgi:peptide/nickel transport system permease protein